MKNFVKNLTICFLLLITTISLKSAGLNKYTVVKPDGTIDTLGLQLSIMDIYSIFQPRIFKKFETIPTVNEIGEAEIVLYHQPGTNLSRLYTVLENATYYITLSSMSGSPTAGIGDMLQSFYDTDSDNIVDDSEMLGGQLPAYYAVRTEVAASTNTQAAQITVLQNQTSSFVDIGSYQIITASKTFQEEIEISSITASDDHIAFFDPYVSGPRAELGRLSATRSGFDILVGSFYINSILRITNAGLFRASSGSPSSPGYQFSGDTDTGFDNYEANKISIITGGIVFGTFTAANFEVGTNKIDGYDISQQFSDVAISTYANYSAIQSTRTALLDVIASSYTTNRTSITNLEISTGAIQTQLTNLDNQVSVDTNTLETAKLDKSSATATYLFKKEKAADSGKLGGYNYDYFLTTNTAGGDMVYSTFKSTYDTNGNGIVDNAEKVGGYNYTTFVDTFTYQTISSSKTFAEKIYLSTITNLQNPINIVTNQVIISSQVGSAGAVGQTNLDIVNCVPSLSDTSGLRIAGVNANGEPYIGRLANGDFPNNLIESGNKIIFYESAIRFQPSDVYLELFNPLSTCKGDFEFYDKVYFSSFAVSGDFTSSGIVSTHTAQTITGQKTFTPTTIFSSATFSGNVGINTTNPTARLSLYGTGTTYSFHNSTATNGTAKNIIVMNNGAISLNTGANPSAMVDLPGDGVSKSMFDYSDKTYIRSTSGLYLNDTNGNVFVGDPVYNLGADLWIADNCSALSYTDRTPYPPDKETAYRSVLSMQKKLDKNELDHIKLDKYILHRETKIYEKYNPITKSTETISELEYGRNLSATVSAQNEVIKDLIKRIEVLENK